MSAAGAAIEAAIARGETAARVLIENRNALFEPMTALLMVTGADGLRACAAGVAEAVIEANRRGRCVAPIETSGEA